MRHREHRGRTADNVLHSLMAQQALYFGFLVIDREMKVAMDSYIYLNPSRILPREHLADTAYGSTT